MRIKISLQARLELQAEVRQAYQKACWKKKREILDAFIATTGYQRKYAINLLNNNKNMNSKGKSTISRKRFYDAAVQQALLSIWHAANQICSKRLVPFLPELIRVLERKGHLCLTPEIRNKLLHISAPTVDRILKSERTVLNQRGLCTTRSGSLLKRQIPIRTFAQWDDVIPGFLEGDLVAHCGNRVDGAFLNTLVLTDIASGWTEFFSLLFRSESEVILGLKATQRILPFPFIGLDTDNGSEFINYGLLNFCEAHKITFTRSRAYRKNDQAHVEEKNGSIIRRIIGYDRYEGVVAQAALASLYAILRIYINFFQPSLKLISKERVDGKVTKKYDKAQTPYQRVMQSIHITDEVKCKLSLQYEENDPVTLLNRLRELQDAFWEHAWKPCSHGIQIREQQKIVAAPTFEQIEPISSTTAISALTILLEKAAPKHYRRTAKPKKELPPRTWRTRSDPFVDIWDNHLVPRLQLEPQLTATSLLEELTKTQPVKFNASQLRTLQRRVANWRAEQVHLIRQQAVAIAGDEKPISDYLTMAMAESLGYDS